MATLRRAADEPDLLVATIAIVLAGWGAEAPSRRLRPGSPAACWSFLVRTASLTRGGRMSRSCAPPRSAGARSCPADPRMAGGRLDR